jgi:hypothetical protein
MKALILALPTALLLLACGGADNNTAATHTPAATAAGQAVASTTSTGVATATTIPTATVAPAATATPSPAATATAAGARTPLASATPAQDEPAATQTPDGGTPDNDDPRIVKVLPTLDDLPAGWTVSTEDDSNDATDSAFCDANDVDFDFGDSPTADASFTSGDFGPFFTVTVTAVGEDTAQQFMQQVDAALSCTTWVDTSDDPPTTWTITTLSVPDLGDGVVARHLEADSGGVPLTADLVFARSGGFVALLGNLSLGPVDSQLTLDQTARVVQALEREFPQGMP